MKANLCRSLFLLIVLAGFSRAASPKKGTGIGFIVGEPTGISAKMWTSSTTALDGALAWSFGKNGRLHLHADHLWHYFNVPKNQPVAFYVGAGGELNLGGSPVLGLRAVAGMNYFFAGIPLDAFFEIVPIFTLLPASGLSAGAGLGLRWFF